MATTQPPRRGALLDKHGHVHSENIFKDWSPAAIVAMGIYRVGWSDPLRPQSASTPTEDVCVPTQLQLNINMEND